MALPQSCSYGGSLFDVILNPDKGTGAMKDASMVSPMVLQWEQKANFSRRHLAGENRDDVQFGGLSNPSLTVDIAFEDDTLLATLKSMIGTTLRTLTGPAGIDGAGGTSVSNVMLTAVGAARRDMTSSSPYYEASVTFEQSLG